MIWIVTWLLISTHIVTCPNNRPYVDDYGVLHTPWTLTCQLCYDTDSSFHRKEFRDKNELDEFIKNMPVSEDGLWYVNNSYCTEVKIDSVDACMED